MEYSLIADWTASSKLKGDHSKFEATQITFSAYKTDITCGSQFIRSSAYE
jgi:hypothetical protein